VDLSILALALSVDISGSAEAFLENHTYIGAFLILTSCGFGMPIPEEVTIVGSGILLHRGVVEYWPILIACWLGVIAGDVVPLTVGRVWGVRAFEHRWVRRILKPERLARLEARFREHLSWGVFTCRFFPGLRWPGYFIAGHLRMPIWKWFLLDALGASIMTPFALYLGFLFGANTDLLAQKVKDFHLVLAFAAFAVLATVLVRSRVVKSRERAAASASAPAIEGEPGTAASTASEPAPAASQAPPDPRF
jgi:membrane protein DedA with SNARE-associated domain